METVFNHNANIIEENENAINENEVFKKLLFIFEPNEDFNKYRNEIDIQQEFALPRIKNMPAVIRKLSEFMYRFKCFINLIEIAKRKYHKDPDFIEYYENIYNVLCEAYPRTSLAIDKRIEFEQQKNKADNSFNTLIEQYN